MNVYLLGSKVASSSLSGLISKWNIQNIENEEGLKYTLAQPSDKASNFIMELSEVNESKYNDLKVLATKHGKKVRFIIFYQTLKPSPVINKLHGAEILLIGPNERGLTPILLKRFFQSSEPLFRRWERIQLVTSGTLSFLSDSNLVQEVKVSNFGAHGAQVEIASENFKKKDFVVFEYVSHDGKKIRMQSRVCWIKAAARVVQAGIQFLSREL